MNLDKLLETLSQIYERRGIELKIIKEKTNEKVSLEQENIRKELWQGSDPVNNVHGI